MTRADRLPRLIGLLRSGGPHRAADLARALGVTVRTIYRDMDTLIASGLPLEGQRGTGYRITSDITLPPLNLEMGELEALHLGLAALAESGDATLARAADSLAAKLDAALPEDGPASPPGTPLSVHPFTALTRGTRFRAPLRQAIRARQKLRLQVLGETRTVRPLRLDYWGRLWTAVVWCETRGDFDEIRLDQIEDLAPLPALFAPEPGRSLPDFDRRAGR